MDTRESTIEVLLVSMAIMNPSLEGLLSGELLSGVVLTAKLQLLLPDVLRLSELLWSMCELLVEAWLSCLLGELDSIAPAVLVVSTVLEVSILC